MAHLFDWLVRVLFRILRIMFPCSLMLIASCTKPTVFPRYLTVSDVINNVKCELYLAIWETPNSAWLNGWTAEFSVVLQVERTTGGNGDLTLVVPYMNPAPGLFTISAGGELSKTGRSRVNFLFNAEENLNVFMSRDRCAYWPQLRGRHNLAGETGLQLWFVNLIEGINHAQIVEQSTGFTYSLNFVTTLEGHIRPSFNTNYLSGRVFSGMFQANHRREDNNELTVAFAPVKPAPPPFAATELGKALARIEAELKEARKANTAAKADVRAHEDKFALMKRDLGDRAPTTDDEKLQWTKLTEGLTRAQEQLKSSENKISGLEAQKVSLQASAAAVAAAGRGVAVSTEQQLNSLITLDAIRNIPRR